jgi:hypothetical protein
MNLINNDLAFSFILQILQNDIIDLIQGFADVRTRILVASRNTKLGQPPIRNCDYTVRISKPNSIIRTTNHYVRWKVRLQVNRCNFSQ